MVVKKYFAPDNKFMAGDIRIRLGKQIRILRLKLSLTQEELADKSGISAKYLQNLEGKKPKTASLITLEKLAKGFGVPVWEIIRFKD